MFSHAVKYDWRLHKTGLRSSVLGSAPTTSTRQFAQDDASDDEVTRSARTDQEMRTYLRARPTRDEAADSDLLNRIVASWRADNAAGGVAAHAHMPLPRSFVDVLVQSLGDANEAERTPMFDNLVRKFEPSVRTLVAQQIAGQMDRYAPLDRPSHKGGEFGSNDRDDPPDSTRKIAGKDLTGGAPWSPLRPSARASFTDPLAGSGDSGERGLMYGRSPMAASPLERNPRGSVGRREKAGRFQELSEKSQSGRTGGSAAGGQGSPYNPRIDDVAKDLQYYGYDPAELSERMPDWRPLVLFDDRTPQGYSDKDVVGGRVRINKRGFGGYLAHRRGTGDFAFMVKGVEVSEGRMNDVLADGYAGADQVSEVAEDIFQQCKAMGVYDAIKHGGSLTIIGHSQGAPSAQLLGVYLIVRALNEKPPLLTEAEALAAIRVRGFGGIGARDYLERLHGPDGKPFHVPKSVLDGIDAVTYIVSGDPLAQRAPVPYIGSAYVVDRPDPSAYTPTEPWAKGQGNPLTPHARSAYKAADYRTARRYKPPTVRDAIGDAIGSASDALGGLVDDLTHWWY